MGRTKQRKPGNGKKALVAQDPGTDSGHFSLTGSWRRICGLGGAVLVVVAFIWGSWYFWVNFFREVDFSTPSLPSELLDAGVDPDLALKQAIEGLPKRLEQLRIDLSTTATSLGEVADIRESGAERFCSDTAGFRRLLKFSPEFFKDLNGLDIGTSGQEKVIDQRSESDVKQAVLNLIRQFTGKEFQSVAINILKAEDGYLIETTVDTYSGAATGRKIQTFRTALPDFKPSDTSSILLDAVLRVSHPEISALLRGARGRTDLEVERFAVSAYPTAEKQVLLLFATFMALNSLETSDASIAAKRSWAVAQQAMAVPGLRQLSFNTTEIELALLAQEEIWTSRLPLADRLVANARAALLEKYAAELGTRYTRGIRMPIEERFTTGGTLLFHMQEMFNLRKPTVARISSFKEAVLENIAFSEDHVRSETSAKALLHDDVILYLSSVLRLLANQPEGMPLAKDVAALLQDAIAFSDGPIIRLQDRWAHLSRSELDFVNGASALFEYALLKVPASAIRLERLLRSSSPCPKVYIGDQIGRIYDRLPASDKHEQMGHLAIALKLLRSAEDAGIRSFELYSGIHFAERRLGEIEAAIAALRTAQAYQGEHPWAKINLGSLYLENGQLGEAQLAFEESLDLTASRCRKDREEWADLDENFNSTMRQTISDDALYEALKIRTEPTTKECSIHNAVVGLLESLMKQDKGRDFVNAYERYIEAGDFASEPSLVREALSRYRVLQCRDTEIKTPVIPAGLAESFPLRDNKFDCAPVRF